MVAPQRIPLPERRSYTRENHRCHGLKGKGPLLITCLGHELEVYSTHYLLEYKTPVACPGIEECHWCKLGHQAIPKGFIAARQHPQNYLFVCEFPEAAARKIIQHPLAQTSLRGRVITIKRNGKNHNSPVWPVLENLLPPDELPEPFDILPFIQNCYNGGLKKVARIELERRVALIGADHQEGTPAAAPSPARQDAQPATSPDDYALVKKIFQQGKKAMFGLPTNDDGSGNIPY